jgi:hypothetical protein
MTNDLKSGYKVGLPAPDDTPLSIEARERMWNGIKAQIRQQETWMQMIRRIVRGLRR